ncbi:hypothetical protein EDD27_9565 [Nonomuraea polychroma]|uniref:Uncharacterized protein n=1 Tax=Nonomuraea polychroma TaxID=46176 RepID=A0A438MLN6_9ACTN|nr:hypothetical protein EDD27_9565 [Nonomuraea polychroma]
MDRGSAILRLRGLAAEVCSSGSGRGCGSAEAVDNSSEVGPPVDEAAPCECSPSSVAPSAGLEAGSAAELLGAALSGEGVASSACGGTAWPSESVGRIPGGRIPRTFDIGRRWRWGLAAASDAAAGPSPGVCVVGCASCVRAAGSASSTWSAASVPVGAIGAPAPVCVGAPSRAAVSGVWEAGESAGRTARSAARPEASGSAPGPVGSVPRPVGSAPAGPVGSPRRLVRCSASGLVGWSAAGTAEVSVAG